MKQIIILIFVSLALAVAQTAQAATITVTTTADSGPGSLRQAILDANVLSGADIINFNLGPGPHTINLAGGLPYLTSDIDIQGPGAEQLTVRRDTGGFYSIFFIDGGNTVGLAGMTIANGAGIRAGGMENLGTLTISDCIIRGNRTTENFCGGIYNRERLTIINSIIRDNSGYFGGGIENSGTLAVTNSIISGNTATGDASGGGGIFNYGTLTVERTIISSNSASAGGGIWNGEGTGVVTVNNSTLIENTAEVEGSAVLNNFFGTCTITGSTIARNVGHGLVAVLGAIQNWGSLDVKTSTVSDNPAGIINESGGAPGTSIVAVEGSTFNGNTYVGILTHVGRVTVANSTLVNNDTAIAGYAETRILVPLVINNCTLSRNGAGLVNLYATFTSHNPTIISNSIIAHNSYGDILVNLANHVTGGFNFIGGDPLLGPLADNGGPTLTMALLPGGPCIDAGDPGFVGPPEFDQRGPGFARVSGGRIDIGAFEVQPPADSDGDGVLDPVDQCPDTPAGDIVNSTGCSISQLVPCEGPQSGGTWKNHGQYVSAVVEVAKDFLNAGLITRKQRTEIVTGAAHSDCGKRR